MAGEFKNITIKFRGDASELTAALARINTDMRGTSRDLNDVQRLMRFKEGADSVEMLGQQLRLTTDRVGEWRERVSALESAQSALGDRTEDNAEQYDRVTLRLQEARVQLEHYVSEMHEAEQAYDRHATKLGSFGLALRDGGSAISKAGEGMQRVGASLTTSVTVPLVALGTATVRASTEIDTALTNVRKTVDGTEEDYERLREAAVAASETQPVDAATLLNIEALGAQLGFDIDELSEFARVASGLDVATNMNWEQAATEMAQFANVMKMDHDDIGRYASAIVALGNNFATTESDVSAMAQRIAGAGAQIGMSVPDVLGMSAALTSMGITAEAGGSAISTIMAGIDKDVATGSENLSRWAEIAGKTPQEFAESWKGDVVGTLGDVLTNMGELKDEGGNLSVLLEDLGIGSIRQTDTLKRLAGNSEQYADAIGMANQAYEENVALQKEVDNRNESTASKFQVLANKITNIAAEIGAPIAEALLDVVDAAEPLIQKVGDLARAFAEMDTEQQQQIVKWGLMAAAAGPLLTVVGKLTSGFGGFLMNLGTTAQNMAGFFGQIQRGEGVMTALESSFSGAGTAISGLKVMLGGLAIGAVVAGIAALAKAYQDTIKEQRDFHEALAGMGGYLDEGAGHLEGFAEQVGLTSTQAKELSTSTEELTKAMQEHDSAMREIEGGARTTSAQLQRYRDVIDELGGKTELSVDQQSKLQWALDGLNEQLGTNYTMEDLLKNSYEDEQGTIDDLVGHIDELIEKRQQEARVKADQSLYDEAVENETRMQDAYANSKRALEEYTRGQIGYYRQTEQFANASEEEIIAFMRDHDETYKQLEQDMRNAGFAAGAAADEVTTAEQRMANDQALINAGYNIDEFRGAMDRAQVTSRDLADVSTSDFQRMLDLCGGDLDRLAEMVRNYSSLKVGGQTVEINADGAMQTLDRFGRKVAEYDGKEVKTYIKTILTDEDRRTLKGEYSGGYSSGGHYTQAKGGAIPRHAAGVIFTGPTLTSVDGQTGIVGEQGAEAYVSAGRNNYIVPLTNKQYSQPFIDDLSAGVVNYLAKNGMLGGSGGPTYVMNGVSYLPGSAIASHMEAIFREVMLEEG